MSKKKANRKKQLKKQLADLRRAGRVDLETARGAVETVAHQAETFVEHAVEQVKEGDFFSGFIGRLFGTS